MTEQTFGSLVPDHTTEDVKKLVESIVGPVNTIERQDFGQINAVYFIHAQDGQEYVIRVSPKVQQWNQFAQEAWAFKKCREVGVPTPEVVAVESESTPNFPEAYMITKRIAGENGKQAQVTDQQKHLILVQLGHDLSLIHTIKLPGFGDLQPQGDEFVGEYKTYWQFVEGMFTDQYWQVPVREQNVLPQSRIDTMRNRLEENQTLLDISQASLLHADAILKNMVVKDGQLVGVLDMESCFAGNPVHDIAYHLYWKEADEQPAILAALKEGYDNKALFDEHFMKKVYLDQLLFTLPKLGFYTRRQDKGGLDFTLRKLDEIEANLTKL